MQIRKRLSRQPSALQQVQQEKSLKRVLTTLQDDMATLTRGSSGQTYKNSLSAMGLPSSPSVIQALNPPGALRQSSSSEDLTSLVRTASSSEGSESGAKTARFSRPASGDHISEISGEATIQVGKNEPMPELNNPTLQRYERKLMRGYMRSLPVKPNEITPHLDRLHSERVTTTELRTRNYRYYVTSPLNTKGTFAHFCVAVDELKRPFGIRKLKSPRSEEFHSPARATMKETEIIDESTATDLYTPNLSTHDLVRCGDDVYQVVPLLAGDLKDLLDQVGVVNGEELEATHQQHAAECAARDRQFPVTGSAESMARNSQDSAELETRKRQCTNQHRAQRRALVRSMGVQLCDSLGRIHDLNAFHGDVKLTNALWTTLGEVSISDAGGTTQTDDDGTIDPPDNLQGTARYMAPEIATTMMDPFARYGKPADVWALGWLLVEAAVGTRGSPLTKVKCPMQDGDVLADFESWRNGEDPTTPRNKGWGPYMNGVKRLDENLFNFLKDRVFDPNPNTRATLGELRMFLVKEQVKQGDSAGDVSALFAKASVKQVANRAGFLAKALAHHELVRKPKPQMPQ